jgi:hypothetical protein
MAEFQTEPFTTTIGSGHVWTDETGIVRIVVEDEHGRHAFRLKSGAQVEAFVSKVLECELVAQAKRLAAETMGGA